MHTLSMSENGRVLIPAAVREQLGFKPNSRIYMEVKDGGLVLMSAAQHFAKLRAFFDEHLNIPPGHSIVDELIADRRAEAAKEDAE